MARLISCFYTSHGAAKSEAESGPQRLRPYLLPTIPLPRRLIQAGDLTVNDPMRVVICPLSFGCTALPVSTAAANARSAP